LLTYAVNAHRAAQQTKSAPAYWSAVSSTFSDRIELIKGISGGSTPWNGVYCIEL
jgi:hypothetical protein